MTDHYSQTEYLDSSPFYNQIMRIRDVVADVMISSLNVREKWEAVKNAYLFYRGTFREFGVKDDYKNLYQRLQDIGDEIYISDEGDDLGDLYGQTGQQYTEYNRQVLMIGDFWADVDEVMCKVGLTFKAQRKRDPALAVMYDG